MPHHSPHKSQRQQHRVHAAQYAKRAVGQLLQRRSYYFVPFGQDDSYKKPCSLKADFTQLPDTLEAALRGVQLQPILL